MRHAINLRSVSRQRGAPLVWDFNGELRRISPDSPRRRDRYGTEHPATPPDNDRDERRDSDDE